MVRTPCCDKSGLRKGTWTPEEDRKLIAYVTRYGCWNWRQLPKFAGLSRCGKSCRLRWMNYLRPNVKRGHYSKEEDELIIKLHGSLGNRWSSIAAHLPGRTDNEIKNHWHTSLKKGSKEASTSGESKRSSQRKRDLKRRMEDANCPEHSTAQQILESSQFSSQTSSNEQSSSTSVSTAAEDSVNITEFSDDFASQLIEESSGSFWTQPFLTEYNYGTIDYPPSPLSNGEEFLSSFGFYDEHVSTLIW